MSEIQPHHTQPTSSSQEDTHCFHTEPRAPGLQGSVGTQFSPLLTAEALPLLITGWRLVRQWRRHSGRPHAVSRCLGQVQASPRIPAPAKWWLTQESPPRTWGSLDELLPPGSAPAVAAGFGA